jgi:tetratricopeptide (TPR) repeat protein
MLPLGEFGKILDRLREAEALAATMEDQPRLGWVCAYLTDYFRQVGDHAGAIDSGQRALAIAHSLGNFALEVATRTYLGQVYHDAGDFRRASEFFRRNVEALGGELSAERLGLPYLPAVHSRAWLAFCLAELGEFAEGIRLAEEGFQMAEAADHPFSLTSACAGLGRAYLCRGDLGRALPVLERGVELSRVWNIRLWFPLLASALGSGYALAGRVAEALSLLEAAVRQHASIRGMAAQSIRITSLGHAYLLANRANDAAYLASRALELARHHQERANEAYAVRLLGEVASRAAPLDADRAEACYREARALAEMLGLSPLTAHCDLGLGKLARERGNRATAETHLTAATALFREMDMRLWLTEAEDELARLG